MASMSGYTSSVVEGAEIMHVLTLAARWLLYMTKLEQVRLERHRGFISSFVAITASYKAQLQRL